MEIKKLKLEFTPIDDEESKKLVYHTVPQEKSGCSISGMCPNGSTIECSSENSSPCQKVYRNVDNSGTLELVGIRCGDEYKSCDGTGSGASFLSVLEG